MVVGGADNGRGVAHVFSPQHGDNDVWYYIGTFDENTCQFKPDFSDAKRMDYGDNIFTGPTVYVNPTDDPEEDPVVTPEDPEVTPGDTPTSENPYTPDDVIRKDVVKKAVEAVISVVTEVFNYLIQSINSIFRRIFKF